MRINYILWLCGIGMGLLTFGARSAPPVDWPQVRLTKVAGGFDYPKGVVSPDDGSKRLFVFELTGRVKIVRDGTVLSVPFLDISQRLSLAPYSGLSSMAFPPGSSAKDHFYVTYNRASDTAMVLSRFWVSANPNVADRHREERILVVPGSGYKNGGNVAFGPDGFLYLSVGDPGGGGAQDRKQLAGKILRLDVESSERPYGIPSDNPFVNDPGSRPEIWALGLGAGARFSFDRWNGDLFMNDFGSQFTEEHHFHPHDAGGGVNFGYPVLRPTAPTPPPDDGSLTNLSTSVIAFDRGSGRQYLAGGLLVRSARLGRLNGLYLFGEHVSGLIRAAARVGDDWEIAMLARTGRSISGFGEDERGYVYVTDYDNGILFRVDEPRQPVTPEFDPAGPTAYAETVTLRCRTPGVTIHYTTNGRTPRRQDPWVLSGGDVPASLGKVIKARAFRGDLVPSEVAITRFTELRVALPTLSPPPGPVTNGTLVTVSSPTPTASLIISFMPPFTALVTNSPGQPFSFVVTNDLSILATASRTGFLPPVMGGSYGSYSLQRPATPRFSPAEGSVLSHTLVTIRSGRAHAEIHYTLDGSVPDASALLYSEPVAVPRGATLRAIALAADHPPSEVQSLTYDAPLVSVVHDPLPGPVPFGSGITLTPTVPGATIQVRLTIDGVDWPEQPYTGPILITNNTVITARGLLDGSSGYSVVSYRYSMVIPNESRVETVAGDGVTDFRDGPAGLAQFFSPTRMCCDSAGNLYVADAGNWRVRKISTSGLVTTVAGVGVPGFRNGPALLARFKSFDSLALDRAGNLYVSDPANQMLRRIDPAGSVATVLKDPSCCGAIDTDSMGNIIVLYDGFTRISPNGRKEFFRSQFPNGPMAFDSHDAALIVLQGALLRAKLDGQIEQLNRLDPPWAFDGPLSSSVFHDPQGVTVDPWDNIYVLDGNRVRIVRTNGTVSTVAGLREAGYRDGVGMQAQFDHPRGICADGKGHIYIADTGNHRIRRIVLSTLPSDLATEPAAPPPNPEPADSRIFVDSSSPPASGQFSVSWISRPGVRYQVQASEDLRHWENVQEARWGHGRSMSFGETSVPSTPNARFFRVLEVP